MTDEQTVLDLDTFEMAEDLFGRDELLSQCREHFSGLRATLDKLHNSSDPSALVEQIHRTQGPSSIFGAEQTFDVVAELEVQLRQQSSVSASDMARVTNVVDQTLQEIEQRLSENA